MTDRHKKINNVRFEELDMKNLQGILDVLVANRNTSIDELDYKNKKVKECFDKFKMFSTTLYDTDQYNQLWKYVGSYKKKLSNLDLKPNTVGSYLFGCMLKDYGDVKDKSQSVLCVNSMKCKGEFNYKDFIFYIDKNGEVKELLVPNNKYKKIDVLIFTEKNFPGFTQANINHIVNSTNDYQVQKVCVFETENNKHILINCVDKINLLPVVVGPTGANLISGVPSSMTGSTGSTRGLYVSTSALFWLAIIIILIVFLIIGFGWWKSYGNATKP